MFDSSERRKLCQNKRETKKFNHLIHCRALPQWKVMLLTMLGLKLKGYKSCTGSNKAKTVNCKHCS